MNLNYTDASIFRDMSDLALLLASDLHIGHTSILRLKSKRPFWVKYFSDGRLHERHFRSVLSWRALMLAVIEQRQQFLVLQMDERRRLGRMFPPEVMEKLATNAKVRGDMLPVVQLYHPDSLATVIITRSRCRGHAVDALHNLSSIGPVFEPIWIADLMRLNSMIGLRLVRDSRFKTEAPIRTYLAAASKAGRIITGPELQKSDDGAITEKLQQPKAIPVVERIFEVECRERPLFRQMGGRTIYDDYEMPVE
ncbi:DUF2958 domain-containing protein [Aliirhizobium cellulosilyticum]|uniref:Uncharacterized protein n=1 Tax=Aliirhizobium cellulosilyticum TaxID=393664 RepID=A0A7W6S4F2_9HYPH|nr:DUF2958 domain-containing protein [Rhizobium cellulosilyticum]MBB4347019.1 hypothetical protein [Rhizobium cellulosilyticum]MBB4410587.1 hypothetical protein [Rhizobium cellulosilyticum]MBB4445275.1 hypothetical protein [Rhizobium cellulosilyticum]